MKLTYSNKGIIAFYIFAPISIIFFYVKQQIENNTDSYRKLVFNNLRIWVFLITGSFLLLLFFKCFAISKSFQFIIRFSFLIFCFGFLIFIFFEKITQDMLFNFSFILVLIFLNICLYCVYYLLLVPFNIKFGLMMDIINSRDIININYGAFIFYNQLELIFHIIKFAPFFLFIH